MSTELNLADYDKIIAADPNNADTYHQRGTLKKKLGDSQGALSDFSKAIEFQPGRGHYYLARGFIRKALGQIDEAIADFTVAIALDPKDAGSYNMRGFCKSDKGDLAGALSDYNKAIELNPALPAPYNNRGLIKAEQRDFPGALADYDQALRLDPNFKIAADNRSLAVQAMEAGLSTINHGSSSAEIRNHRLTRIVEREKKRKRWGILVGAVFFGSVILGFAIVGLILGLFGVPSDSNWRWLGLAVAFFAGGSAGMAIDEWLTRRIRTRYESLPDHLIQEAYEDASHWLRNAGIRTALGWLIAIGVGILLYFAYKADPENQTKPVVPIVMIHSSPERETYNGLPIRNRNPTFEVEYHNESDQRLVVDIVIKDAEGKEKESGKMAFGPNESINGASGFYRSGDTIRISHEGYEVRTWELP